MTYKNWLNEVINELYRFGHHTRGIFFLIKWGNAKIKFQDRWFPSEFALYVDRNAPMYDGDGKEWIA